MTEWLQLKRLERNNLPLPKYETEHSAGIDFSVCLTRTCKECLPGGSKRKFLAVDKGGHGFGRHHFGEENVPDIIQCPNGPDKLAVVIQPRETLMLPLGWIAEFGANFVLKIHVRSSAGLNGLMLANGTGIVDPDYRGELFACLWNRTDGPIQIKHGQRVVQGVMLAFNQAIVTEAKEVSETGRGDGGFGSTGDQLTIPAPAADPPPQSGS